LSVVRIVCLPMQIIAPGIPDDKPALAPEAGVG
jgi:hypothetical protein